MALSLQISVVQSNDNKTLQVTDNTGIYNAVTNTGGWGSPNPTVAGIADADKHLHLDVIYTDSAGTATTYDQIDLETEFGPFTDVTDLVFDITPDLLISGGTAMGTSDDELLDGWYKLTYSYADTTTPANNDSVEYENLIDGVVTVLAYNKLKDVPYINSYERFSNDFKEWDDILYPLYYYSLLQGMNAEVNLARKNEVLTMLGTLQVLLT